MLPVQRIVNTDYTGKAQVHFEPNIISINPGFSFIEIFGQMR
jgi:hypothetical protein